MAFIGEGKRFGKRTGYTRRVRLSGFGDDISDAAEATLASVASTDYGSGFPTLPESTGTTVASASDTGLLSSLLSSTGNALVSLINPLGQTLLGVQLIKAGATTTASTTLAAQQSAAAAQGLTLAQYQAKLAAASTSGISFGTIAILGALGAGAWYLFGKKKNGKTGKTVAAA